MRPADSGAIPRSCSAKTVPRAITNRLRSLASRVSTSCARPSAGPPGRRTSGDSSAKGITATDARRAGLAPGSTRGGVASSTVARRQASRSGPRSSPSLSNICAVDSRCRSPSRMRPCRASAANSASCTRRSNGASASHFSRCANTSSPEARRASGSSTAAWQPRSRRRCAPSQWPSSGAASSSSPSRKSPESSRAESARSSSTGRSSSPACTARATSRASTSASARSSLTVSPSVATRGRFGASTSRRILDRHQRSSPRGSFGTSQNSSHRWPRVTGRGASAR